MEASPVLLRADRILEGNSSRISITGDIMGDLNNAEEAVFSA